MKINPKTDYTSLFSSFNKGNTLGVSLTDYASIKNGSYGKLLKSYYSTKKADDKKSTENAPKSAADILKTEEAKKTSDTKDTKETAKKKKYEPKVDTLSKILSDKAKGTYNKSAKYADKPTDAGSVIDSTL